MNVIELHAIGNLGAGRARIEDTLFAFAGRNGDEPERHPEKDSDSHRVSSTAAICGM
jgi:hypothetical protein